MRGLQPPASTPPQEDAVVFESSQHELDCVKEEEPCDDHNDSEQGECLHVHVNTPQISFSHHDCRGLL